MFIVNNFNNFLCKNYKAVLKYTKGICYSIIVLYVLFFALSNFWQIKFLSVKILEFHEIPEQIRNYHILYKKEKNKRYEKMCLIGI